MKRTLSELKATAIAMALSVSLLALASCNGTSDNDSMQTTDMTNDQELDPQGLLSSLSFKSSADDAQFQCLLSAIDSTAAEQDLKSYAPHFSDLAQQGIFKTWCNSNGAIESDGGVGICERGLIEDMTTPGGLGLSLWTSQESVDAVVNDYGHTAITVPDQGVGGWQTYFRRSLGTEDGFYLRFVGFDGDQLDFTKIIKLYDQYSYSDTEIGLTEVFVPQTSPSELIALLRESPARFESVVTEHYGALSVQVEQAINGNDTLDEDAKTAALTRASVEIGDREALMNSNIAELHPLFLNMQMHGECEQ